MNQKKVTFDGEWPKVEAGFKKILTAIQTGIGLNYKEWMQYYDGVFQLAIAQHEEREYVNIARVFEEFLTDQAKLIQSKGPSAELMLKEYLKLLTEYQKTSLSVSRICNYLQRYWIPGNTGKTYASVEVRNIFPLALVMWRKHCFDPIKEQLIPSLLDLLDADRARTRGDVDKGLLRSMVQSYIEFDKVGPSEGQQFYEKEFEAKYLDRLKQFYAAESTEFLSHNSVAQYCEKAEARILEEQQNSSFLGDYAKSSEPKIKRCLDEVLIEKHMDRLQGDFLQMLEEDRYEDMRRLYFLLERVPVGLPNTADTMQVYLTSVGEKILKAQASRPVKEALVNAVAFVKQLMAFYDKYAKLVRDRFESHHLFKTALDKAMKEVMNMDAGKFNIPRLLNFFLDSIIKGKEKDVASEDDVEEVLSTCVALFTYLTDKDEFYEYYRKALSKRLLSKGKSYNENSEKSLLSKLKAQSGDAAIRKLQGMFTDVEAESLAQNKEEFDAFMAAKGATSKLDIDVSVLNEGHWPITATQKFPLLLEAGMLDAKTRFEQFYKSRYEKRALDWLFNYGTVTLNSYFTNSKLPIQLVLTPLQASIVLAFNERTTLSFQELIEALWGAQGGGGAGAGRTMLTASQSTNAIHDLSLEEILKFAISPLVYFKFKILQKVDDPDPTKESISKSDSFKLRDRIPAKKLPRKIPFPAGSAKQAERESNQDREAVLRQREFEMEACMVRTMKARNRLGWNALQVEVVDQLKERFMPDGKMLKKRLESLIDRRFIERDSDDPKTLVYIS